MYPTVITLTGQGIGRVHTSQATQALQGTGSLNFTCLMVFIDDCAD